MPRNSGGTYSLVAGNPVVTATVIASSWANTTMADIATAMTDSLSRSAQGGMLAQLALFAGVIGTPGLSWTAEPTSGLYRAAAGDFRWAIGGVDVFGITTAGIFTPQQLITGTVPELIFVETDAAANNRRSDIVVNAEIVAFRFINDANNSATNWLTVNRTLNVCDSIDAITTLFTHVGAVTITGTLIGAAATLSGALIGAAATFSGLIRGTASGGTLSDAAFAATSTVPGYILNETDGSADNKQWRWLANAETMVFSLVNDANNAATDWLRVDRTAMVVDTVNFCPVNGVLQYVGQEVGWKGIANSGNQAGNYTVLATDNGKMVRYTGAGGNTISLDNSVMSANNEIVTIVNEGTGAVTIGGTLTNKQWLNGSGTVGTGNRTLAVAGVATIHYLSSSFAQIYGAGLS